GRPAPRFHLLTPAPESPFPAGGRDAKIRRSMKHLRRLFPYLRRHRRAYLLGMAMLLPATACGAVVPWLVRTLFQRLERGGTRPARSPRAPSTTWKASA